MSLPSLTPEEVDEGLGKAPESLVQVLILRELRKITALLKEIERRTPDPF